MPGPLAGRRVVVTRARDQASSLVERFTELGAMVVEAPVIRAELRSDDAALQDAIAQRYDWVMFTSASGVAAYFEALACAGTDARHLAGSKVGAIGDATADALRARSVMPDFVPSKATAERLAAEAPLEAGQTALFPASSLSDDRFAAEMRERGVNVTQVVAYDNHTETLDAQQVREVLDADAITFTSASTARNLREALPEGTGLEGAKLVSIGPKTSEAVTEAFGRVDREAATPSLDALVDATREVLA
ncbi:MAG: uroporphyrinogen-III synthase [Dehalococcoidia bacterium]|nr:uroporphyrinogen-III synthase [Dehalococcoidia bacterium]